MTDDEPGYIYRRNMNTGEIHRLDAAGRSHETCNLDDLLPENREDIAEEDALHAVAEDTSRACGNCWPSDEAENVVPI